MHMTTMKNIYDAAFLRTLNNKNTFANVHNDDYDNKIVFEQALNDHTREYIDMVYAKELEQGTSCMKLYCDLLAVLDPASLVRTKAVKLVRSYLLYLKMIGTAQNITVAIENLQACINNAQPVQDSVNALLDTMNTEHDANPQLETFLKQLASTRTSF